jgi:DNA gyrase/topoisomerase IV subunit B
MAEEEVIYNEDSIRSLDWREHIRLRPGRYIGKLGDGLSEGAITMGTTFIFTRYFDSAV